MARKKVTREEMWSRQQIGYQDVDYSIWWQQRELLQQFSRITQSCLFTVDVYKGRYDFASANFADIFGFNPSHLAHIQQEGDLLEERIHPDDRTRLIDLQIQHSCFIYSLPLENRNDYSQVFQFRMLNRKQEYINVISRQQVLQKDRNGKAWIIMGKMDLSPDQLLTEQVKRSVFNLKTGELVNQPYFAEEPMVLTAREKEILNLIRQGLLSKEIAHKLQLSIYTVNNHRKNILAKLKVDNAIEAINKAHSIGLLY